MLQMKQVAWLVVLCCLFEITTYFQQKELSWADVTKHSDHPGSQTSPQAVVTNNEFLATQFKGSRTPCLLKPVKMSAGNNKWAWESRAKVRAECCNCLVKLDLHILHRDCCVSAPHFTMSPMTTRTQHWSQCVHTSAVQVWLLFSCLFILKINHIFLTHGWTNDEGISYITDS